MSTTYNFKNGFLNCSNARPGNIFIGAVFDYFIDNPGEGKFVKNESKCQNLSGKTKLFLDILAKYGGPLSNGMLEENLNATETIFGIRSWHDCGVKFTKDELDLLENKNALTMVLLELLFDRLYYVGSDNALFNRAEAIFGVDESKCLCFNRDYYEQLGYVFGACTKGAKGSEEYLKWLVHIIQNSVFNKDDAKGWSFLRKLRYLVRGLGGFPYIGFDIGDVLKAYKQTEAGKKDPMIKIVDKDGNELEAGKEFEGEPVIVDFKEWWSCIVDGITWKDGGTFGTRNIYKLCRFGKFNKKSISDEKISDVSAGVDGYSDPAKGLEALRVLGNTLIQNIVNLMCSDPVPYDSFHSHSFDFGDLLELDLADILPKNLLEDESFIKEEINFLLSDTINDKYRYIVNFIWFIKNKQFKEQIKKLPIKDKGKILNNFLYCSYLNHSVYGIYALAYNIDPIVEIFKKADGSYEGLENKVDFFVKSDATKHFESKNPYHLIQEFMINQFWLLNEGLKNKNTAFANRAKMAFISSYITKAICKLKPLKYYSEKGKPGIVMFKSASETRNKDVEMSSEDFVDLVRENNGLLRQNESFKNDYDKWQWLFMKPDGSDFINFIDTFEPENDKDLMPKSFLKYLVGMIKPGSLTMDKNEIENFLKKIESKFGKLDFVGNMEDKAVLLGLLASFKKIDKKLLGCFSFDAKNKLKLEIDRDNGFTDLAMNFKEQKFDLDVITDGCINVEFVKKEGDDDLTHAERLSQIRDFVEKYVLVPNPETLLSNPLGLKRLFDDEKLFVCTFRDGVCTDLFGRAEGLGIVAERFEQAYGDLITALDDSDDVFYKKYEEAKKILDDAIDAEKAEEKEGNGNTDGGQINPNENNSDQNKKTKQLVMNEFLKPLKDSGVEDLTDLYNGLIKDIEKIDLSLEPYKYGVEIDKIVKHARNSQALFETTEKLKLYAEKYRSVAKFIKEAKSVDKNMPESEYKRSLADIENKLTVLDDTVEFIKNSTKDRNYLGSLAVSFIENVEKISDEESLSSAAYSQKLNKIRIEFENTVKNKKLQEDILNIVKGVMTSSNDNDVKKKAADVIKQVDSMKIDGSDDTEKKLSDIKNKFGEELKGNNDAKEKFDAQNQTIEENNAKENKSREEKQNVKKRVEQFNKLIEQRNGKPEDRAKINTVKNEKKLADFYKHVDELKEQNKTNTNTADRLGIFDDLKKEAALIQRQIHPEVFKAKLELKENICLKRFLERTEKKEAINRAANILKLENPIGNDSNFSSAIKEIEKVSTDESKSTKNVRTAIKNILVEYGNKYKNTEIKTRIDDWIKAEEKIEKEKVEKEKNEKDSKLNTFKDRIEKLKTKYKDYDEILNLINKQADKASKVKDDLSAKLYDFELIIIISELECGIFDLKEKIENSKGTKMVLDNLRDEIGKIGKEDKYKDNENVKNAVNTAYKKIGALQSKNYSSVDFEASMIRKEFMEAIDEKNNLNSKKEPKESNKATNLEVLYDFKKELSDNVKTKFCSELIRLEYNYTLLESSPDDYLKEIESFTNIVVNTEAYEEFMKDIDLLENDRDYDIRSEARKLKTNYDSDFSELDKPETKKLPEAEYNKKLDSLKNKIKGPLDKLKKKKANKDELKKFVDEKKAALSGTSRYNFFYSHNEGYKYLENLEKLAGDSKFSEEFNKLKDLCNKMIADLDKLKKFVDENKKELSGTDYKFFFYDNDGRGRVEELEKLAGKSEFEKNLNELESICAEKIESSKNQKADINKLKNFVDEKRRAFDRTDYEYFFSNGKGYKHVEDLKKFAGKPDFGKKFKELEDVCDEITEKLKKQSERFEKEINILIENDIFKKVIERERSFFKASIERLKGRKKWTDFKTPYEICLGDLISFLGYTNNKDLASEQTRKILEAYYKLRLKCFDLQLPKNLEERLDGLKDKLNDEDTSLLDEYKKDLKEYLKGKGIEIDFGIDLEEGDPKDEDTSLLYEYKKDLIDLGEGDPKNEKLGHDDQLRLKVIAELIARNIEDPEQKKQVLELIGNGSNKKEAIKQLEGLKQELENTVLDLDESKKKELAAKLLGVELTDLDNLLKPENRLELIEKSFKAAESFKKSAAGFSWGAGGSGALTLVAIVVVALSATGFLASPLLIPFAIASCVCGLSTIGLGTKAGFDKSNVKSLDTKIISPIKETIKGKSGDILSKIPKAKTENGCHENRS